MGIAKYMGSHDKIIKKKNNDKIKLMIKKVLYICIFKNII